MYITAFLISMTLHYAKDEIWRYLKIIYKAVF